MKGLFSLILAIILCLTIFTSCGNRSEELPQESETTTAATTTSVTTVPESEEEYYVTSWTEENGLLIVEETYVSGNGKTLYRHKYYPNYYESADEIQAKYPDKTVLV
ncbi:MAG: hypothetical protein LUH18_07300 [Oscillospiraceae bacterium]|nr:hypothetical protein [Oscillospiraceae bacterium]